MAGPNASAIHLIHRASDGFIPLARKPAGDWQELGAVPVNQPLLPHLLELVNQDGYFGVNSSFRTGHRFTTRQTWMPILGEQPGAEQQIAKTVRQSVNPATQLPYAHHQTDALRWLNVAYTDLDGYKLGLSTLDMLDGLQRLQESGDIPPATMFARSGRGLWAFWCLLDAKNPTEGECQVHGATHTPYSPQRASGKAIALYARVQHAIAKRLTHLGADLGALDGARFAPVPGTLKTAQNTRVHYWLQAGESGEPFAYTLSGLARALGLPLTQREHPIVEQAFRGTRTLTPDTVNEAKSTAGRKGWRVRWERTLADFEILLRLRGGGFDEGRRSTGAFYYALILRKAGMPDVDTRGRLRTYANLCRPALDEHAIAHAMKQAKRPRGHHLSTARLIAELGITEKESTYLEQWGRVQPKGATNGHQADARRQFLRDWIAQLGGFVPSTRLAASHCERHGFSSNNSTIWRDYLAMGYQPTEAKGGRPRNTPLLEQ
jgi:hypothetical protein